MPERRMLPPRGSGLRTGVTNIQTLESRTFFSAALFSAHLQFEASTTTPPAGYVADTGAVYGDRGNGFTYGWNIDNSANIRTRHSVRSPDPRYDSLAHMQKPGGATKWELALPNGTYTVHVVAGDPDNVDSNYVINFENTPVISGKPSTSRRWFEATSTIVVADGELTVTNGKGSINNKINFIDVQQIPQAPHITWTVGAPMPVPRTEGSGWVADGKLFTFGGFYNAKLQSSGELDSYDPATNTWTRLADCPLKVNDCPVAYDAVTDTAWIGGAYVDGDRVASSAIYQYDIKNNVWSAGPSLPENIGAGQMGIVGRELHYFGGRLENRAGQATHWRLNLDSENPTWVNDTPMPSTANHFATAVVNGKIYAIGGITDKQESTGNLTAVWVYDPATRAWSSAAPLPAGRGHIAPSATVIDGKIVIPGGQLNGGANVYTATVLSYDPVLNKWSYLTPLPMVRSSSIVGYINGKLIVAGGNLPYAPWVTNQVWIGTFS